MNSFYGGTISSVYATNDLQKIYPNIIYDIIYETKWFYCVIKIEPSAKIYLVE